MRERSPQERADEDERLADVFDAAAGALEGLEAEEGRREDLGPPGFF